MHFKTATAAQMLVTQEIFHDVLSVEVSKREAFLSSRCNGDTALIEELRSLLAACEAEEALCSQLAEQSADAALTRRRFGNYTLDRLLGRGGMGAVYLAHRSDGQFQQQVAIKLIELPLATAMFRDRFLQERQILAGLVHPYIARLLDGGVTDEDEPYLTMEYVDGVSLTAYCQQQQLPLAQRLRLFQRICEAVQFAHRNLVVHRDLKPDNILVVADDSPRLLDFGTAKLLAVAENAVQPDWTRQGLQAFTPQYASPEQVLGNSITTASDIYSLGVLLYWLVTGALPYVLQEFTTAEMLRVICNDLPPKPSTRTAQGPLDPDIDAIVMKALRKAPEERYSTVDVFASDIQAYLESRPVQAQRGSTRYRAGKFMRRNRLSLSAAALFALTVVAGMGGVLWQSRVANLERRKAEARSVDLRELSNSLLLEIDGAIKELPGSTPVQALLVQRVSEHLDRMANDAAGDRQAELQLIDAYTRLGNLQGNIYEQNIGDSSGALVSLNKAIVIAQSLYNTDPNALDTLNALALALQSRSAVLMGIGRPAESLASIRSSVQAFDTLVSRRDATPEQIANAATAYSDLGDQLGQPGFTNVDDPGAALEAYNKSLQLSLQSLRINPALVRSQRSVATDHIKIGIILVDTDPMRAIKEYRESLAARDALPSSEKSTGSYRRIVAMTYWQMGVAMTEARDYEHAIAAFEQARSSMQQLAAEDPKNLRAQYDMAATQYLEATTYIDMINPVLNRPGAALQKVYAQRALDLLQRSIKTKSQLVAADPANERWVVSLAVTQAVAGTLEEKLGARSDGARLSAVGIATLRELCSKDDTNINNLANTVEVMLKVLPLSLRDAKAIVGYAERLAALDHHKTPGILLMLAQAYRANGQSAQADATAQAGLALLRGTGVAGGKTRMRQLLEMAAVP